MNVLLLYPEFPDTFWSFKHALSFVGKKASPWTTGRRRRWSAVLHLRGYLCHIHPT